MLLVAQRLIPSLMPLRELVLPLQCPGASGVSLEVLAESFKIKEAEVKQVLEEAGEPEEPRGSGIDIDFQWGSLLH